MPGVTQLQILRAIYLHGGEASRPVIEDDLQMILGSEPSVLKMMGLVVSSGDMVTLTLKGASLVEERELVSLAQIQDCQHAREMVRKALRCVLHHDAPGYNAIMQEARKAFTSRYIGAIEHFYAAILP